MCRVSWSGSEEMIKRAHCVCNLNWHGGAANRQLASPPVLAVMHLSPDHEAAQLVPFQGTRATYAVFDVANDMIVGHGWVCSAAPTHMGRACGKAPHN